MENFPKPHEIDKVVTLDDASRNKPQHAELAELDQSSIESRYEYLKFQALIDAVTRGILAKKDLLTRIGAIPPLKDKEIEKYIDKIFKNAAYIFRTQKSPAAQSWQKSETSGKNRESSPQSGSSIHQQYLSAQNLIRLLGYADITVPSILNDWSIDRNEAETGRLLGVKSLRHIERVLARRCADKQRVIFRHIHKGPGNGSLMQKMQQAARHEREQGADREVTGTGEAPRAEISPQWEEYGIGDRLYFDLRPILEKFIAKHRRDDPKTTKFVELLSLALGRALKKRWYEAKGNILSEWTPKTEIFDLNAIFELLAHPEPWIKNFIEEKVEEEKKEKEHTGSAAGGAHTGSVTENVKDAKRPRRRKKKIYRLGGEFEDQLLEELDPEMYRFFEICRGKLSPSQIVAQLDAKRRREERECGQKLHLLKRLRSQIFRQEENEKLDEKKIRKNQNARDRWAKLYAFWMDEEPKKGLEKFALAILFGNGVRQLEEELRIYGKITTAVTERDEFKRSLDTTPLQPAEFFSRIFSRHFVDAIKNADFYEREDYRKFSTYPFGSTSTNSSDSATGISEPPAATSQDSAEKSGKTVLDLNGHPVVHPQNFIPGFFTDMPAIFPPRSAMLLSACRSDSHEKEADFEKDIARNLDLLAPGGIIITDGIRGSYTRIDRFDEVQAAIKSKIESEPDKNEYRAEIILDAKAQPIALLVQRRDENGEFLTRQEKDEILGEKFKIRSLKSVAARPDLTIINNVRRKILDFAHDDVKVFEQLHEVIRTQCRAALRGLSQNDTGKNAEKKLMDQIQKLLQQK